MHRVLVVLALSLVACGASTEEDAVGGSASSPLDLAAFVYCDASVTVAGDAFWVEHSAYYFGDGSTLATCSIHDNAREYSSTSLYGPNSPNAADAQCALTYDVDFPSGGTWYFTQSGGGAPVSQGYYHDPGDTMNGYIVDLDCVAY